MPAASSGATWARLVMLNVVRSRHCKSLCKSLPRSGVRNPGKRFGGDLGGDSLHRNIVLDSGRIALRIEGGLLQWAGVWTVGELEPCSTAKAGA